MSSATAASDEVPDAEPAQECQPTEAFDWERLTFRRLVTNGPVEVASIGERELAVFASEIDVYSMHDGLLAAAHRVQNTNAIVTKDDAFAGEETVWE